MSALTVSILGRNPRPTQMSALRTHGHSTRSLRAIQLRRPLQIQLRRPNPLRLVIQIWGLKSKSASNTTFASLCLTTGPASATTGGCSPKSVISCGSIVGNVFEWIQDTILEDVIHTNVLHTDLVLVGSF